MLTPSTKLAQRIAMMTPVSDAARATQSNDNNSDTTMPPCTASVPVKWGR